MTKWLNCTLSDKKKCIISSGNQVQKWLTKMGTGQDGIFHKNKSLMPNLGK